MNCKVCGAQLTGVENVCPGCGNPVEKEIPVAPVADPAVPVVPAAPEVAVAPVEQAVPPMAEVPVTPVDPAVPVVPAAPEMPAMPVAPEMSAMPAAPVVDPAVPVVDPAVPVVDPAAPVVPEVPVAPVEQAVPALQSMPEMPAAPVAAPVAPAMPEVAPVAGPVMNSSVPVMNSAQPVNPMGGQPAMGQVPGQPAEKPKQNKTVLLIIILIGVVAIAAVSLFALGVFDGEESESPSSGGGNSGGDSGDIVERNDTTETYAGYTFTIPEGYTSSIDDKSGLIVENSKLGFSILVDYTNTFEKYKEEYSKKYPEYANSMVATIGGRQYIGLMLTKDGKNAAYYVSKDKNSDVTFVGIIANSSYTDPSESDFAVLTKVLDSAKSGSKFAPGDAGDAGANGVVSDKMDLDIIKFSE